MNPFEPRDLEFDRRVRDSFARQELMRTIGARLERVEPGEVTVRCDYRSDLTQQAGLIHAGIVAALADTACGYAAYTLMAAGSDVVSVEFKLNLVAPADGPHLIARASVLRPGRTLTVCRAEVVASSGEEERLVAVMQATMMAVEREEAGDA